MSEILRRDAVTIRPKLQIILAVLVVLCLLPILTRADTSPRRENAKTQFDHAEKERQTLEAQPEKDRKLKEYASVVETYRRVYLITPRAAEVPAALNHVAELYCAMGDLFDEKYYQLAVNSYQFLLKEYPTSHYREDAMLAIGNIEKDDLHDPVLAQKTFEQFIALHPKSTHVKEVRAIIAGLNGNGTEAKAALKPAPSPASDRSLAQNRSLTPNRSSTQIGPPVKDTLAENALPTTDTTRGAASEINPAHSSAPQVTRIRTWNADTYTRIVIDVNAQVKYQAARISGPDRIYFDIEGTKINSDLLHKPIEIPGGGFLKGVRVAQNQQGVVRVVLEVNQAKDYSVFLLPDPYRLIVDVYGSSASAEEVARATAPPPGPTTTDIPPASIANPAPARNVAAKAPAKPELASNESSTTKTGIKKNLKAAPASSARVQNIDSASGSDSSTSPQLSAENSTAMPPLVARPASAKMKTVRGTKSAHDQAEEMGPASVPEMPRAGQQSLSRALGLKIGRIVIDAGHGGHDTGTIGPSGLMEKDLCLDVALRVGKLIQQRLPAADVIYTRDDDTFIPLDRRTEIANEAKADLFLSVHANSSPDHQARGIETYYLNFTGSSDAMEVAARENALSGNAVHDLQDIVNKIARNEKIEESRDLAGTVQDSLANRVEGVNRGDKSRGVRKAPFVVLIGANMPSVLAEISFISNPSDEQWLKKPESRQKVAEGLYRGIEKYLQSTNSLAMNQVQVRQAQGNRPAGVIDRSANPQ